VALALAFPAALGLWAVLEPGRLVTRDRTLALAGWPSALDGFKVVVIADLHVGSWLNGLGRLPRLVARSNELAPDMVVLLGDLVHGGTRGVAVEPEPIAAELRKLQARVGVFAVLGNHDWWYDGERVRRALSAVGVRVLEEEWVDAGGLYLAGVGDLATRDPQPAWLVGKVPPGAPVLLLTHEPDLFPEVPARVTLTLAGHTHGGQVRLPLIGAPVVPSRFGQRYAGGLVVEQGRPLFVTTGVGTSILPIRFGVPPEIVLLRLRPAPH
jgi:predicted MPP superfamily phosphohydrolase